MKNLNARLVVSIRLNNCIPLVNRKRKNIYPFWELFNQFLNNSMLWTSIYQLRTKWGKIKTPKTFRWKQKYFHGEIWKIFLQNTEDKILDFQFEPVSAKPTRPSYNDGRDQDKAQEPKTQHNRLSSKKWCSCQNCGKMPTIRTRVLPRNSRS